MLELVAHLKSFPSSLLTHPHIRHLLKRAMPVQTVTLSESPVLVQQHILTTDLSSKHAPQTISASILTYGATVTHLKVPDRRGESQDIVLGFDHWEDYLAQAQSGALNPYFGATIGRTASR